MLYGLVEYWLEKTFLLVFPCLLKAYVVKQRRHELKNTKITFINYRDLEKVYAFYNIAWKCSPGFWQFSIVIFWPLRHRLWYRHCDSNPTNERRPKLSNKRSLSPSDAVLANDKIRWWMPYFIEKPWLFKLCNLILFLCLFTTSCSCLATQGCIVEIIFCFSYFHFEHLQ